MSVLYVRDILVYYLGRRLRVMPEAEHLKAINASFKKNECPECSSNLYPKFEEILNTGRSYCPKDCIKVVFFNRLLDVIVDPAKDNS